MWMIVWLLHTDTGLNARRQVGATFRLKVPNQPDVRQEDWTDALLGRFPLSYESPRLVDGFHFKRF